MEKSHRNAIRKSWTFIINTLTTEQNSCIMDYLMEKHILTTNMREEIECVKTTSDKNRKLLSIIPRRGPRAFELFIDSLYRYDLNFVAEYIMSNIEFLDETVPNIQIQPIISDVVTVQAVINNETDTTLCNICMDNMISVALNPCGHTFCSTCGDIFLLQRECCICKQTVTNTLRIFL